MDVRFSQTSECRHVYSMEAMAWGISIEHYRINHFYIWMVRYLRAVCLDEHWIMNIALQSVIVQEKLTLDAQNRLASTAVATRRQAQQLYGEKWRPHIVDEFAPCHISLSMQNNIRVVSYEVCSLENLYAKFSCHLGISGEVLKCDSIHGALIGFGVFQDSY